MLVVGMSSTDSTIKGELGLGSIYRSFVELLLPTRHNQSPGLPPCQMSNAKHSNNNNGVYKLRVSIILW